MDTERIESHSSGNVIACGDLVVIPGLTDRVLAQAYLKMLKDGLLDVVYAQQPVSLLEFIQVNLLPGRIALGCFRRVRPEGDAEAEKVDFCGMGWASEPAAMGGGFTKSEVGMVFFREPKLKPEQTQVFGRLMLRHVFESVGVDFLFGTTPQPNTAALLYMQKLGFKTHGPIPNFTTWHGQPAGVVISSMSKEAWKESGR